MFNCNYGPNPFPNTDGLYSATPQYRNSVFQNQMVRISGSSTPIVSRKRKSDGRDVLPDGTEKNPLQLLNEVYPGCKFELVRNFGPPHNPVFVMDLRLVDGQCFQASGRSKQAAKTAAACLALAPSKKNSLATTSMSDSSRSFVQEHEILMPNCKKARQLKLVNLDGSFKTPLAVLFETGAKITFDKEEMKDNPITKEKYFLLTIKVDDKEFTAEARSKKMTRHRCAQIALREMYNVNVNLPCEILANGGKPTGSDSGAEVTSFSLKEQAFADKVQRKILERFRMLQLCVEKQFARRKVLAGIVMTRVDAEGSSNNTETNPSWTEAEPEVICITSGTKCLGGEFLSRSGCAVNDCHAEILARRCLQRFLYCQLELLLDIEEARKAKIVSEQRLKAAQSLCVVEWSSVADGEELRKFQLRQGVDFHIYINTAPCGDARVFSPHEIPNDTPEDEHPTRRNRGVLRTKIESGEGTVPLADMSEQQTWDAIMSGERLLTMSCSDKMCAWNAVGLQGALLSRLLNQAIYPASVVLGNLYNAQHLTRALIGRLEAADGSLAQRLPTPFRVHKPRLLTVTEKDARQVGSSPNFALNWIVTDDVADVVKQLGPAAQNEANISGGGPEIVACLKGRLIEDWPSRLCKQAMLWRFTQVAARLGWPSAVAALKAVHQEGASNGGELTYAEMKEEATEYQHAKEYMRQVFKSAGLGSWAQKPVEQDQFELLLLTKNKPSGCSANKQTPFQSIY